MAPAASTIVPVRSAEQMARAYAIRRRVFIEEQGIDPNLERDIDDLSALHVLALDGAQAVGCGRMVLSHKGAKIGRMAVLAESRGRGFGRLVLGLSGSRGARGRSAPYLPACAGPGRRLLSQMRIFAGRRYFRRSRHPSSLDGTRALSTQGPPPSQPRSRTNSFTIAASAAGRSSGT